MTETKQRRHLKRCARFKARRVKLVGVELLRTDIEGVMAAATAVRHHNFNRNQAKRFLKRHVATDVDGRKIE